MCLGFLLFVVILICIIWNFRTKLFTGGSLHMNLAEPHATDVRTGKKTWEGRLNKGKFALMRIGDVVRINRDFNVRITGKSTYSTFKEFIDDRGLDKVLPTEYEKGSTTTQAISVYRKFYSKKKESQYGVLGLGVEVIN